MSCQATLLALRADGGIRTPDQLITNQLLWPTELHRHTCYPSFGVANICHFFYSAKSGDIFFKNSPSDLFRTFDFGVYTPVTSPKSGQKYNSFRYKKIIGTVFLFLTPNFVIFATEQQTQRVMAQRTLLYIMALLLSATSLYGQQLSDFLAAARSGNPVAQYNAAICYERGMGTAPNATRSAHFMRLAAENGLPEAQQYLARKLATSLPQLATYWANQATTPNTPAFTVYEGYDNGCYYGQLRGGTRDGYGAYLWDTGVCYVGEWENDERHGMGRTECADQTHYGRYINHATGFGVTIVSDTLRLHLAHCPAGVCYVGNYSGGLPDGLGTIYNSAGEVVYFGPFEAGRPTNTYPSTEHYSAYRWVREQLPSGDTYEGETVGGLREGFGIYRWSTGAVWFGFWQGGVRSGEGLFIDTDGQMVAGLWSDDEYRE